MRRFKFSHSVIRTSTPAELNMYYGIISKDLEREKREQENQERSGTSHVSPPKNLPLG